MKTKNIIITFSVMALFLGTAALAIEVPENCWMEQRICIQWKGFLCKAYGWIAQDCDTAGLLTGDCRVKCNYTDVASEEYIQEHEGEWSKDTSSSGMSSNWIIKKITEAVDALKTEILGTIEDMKKDLTYYKDKTEVMQEFLYQKYGKEYCDFEAAKLIERGYDNVECGGEVYYNLNNRTIQINPA